MPDFRKARELMRARITLTLPLVQVALAVALVVSNRFWRFHCDMPEMSPAWLLLISINVPAALLRGFWGPMVEGQRDINPEVLFWAEGGLFVASSGLLWYWVARNVVWFKSNKTVVTFRWLPLRVASDLLIIASMLWWGFATWKDMGWSAGLRGYSCYRPLVLSQWMTFASLSFQIGWVFVLIAAYGRDVVFSVWHSEKPRL